MVSISERPAEVEDRAVPGHWEGDLVVGAYGRSAVATLVERQTRFVMLAYLGTDHRTETVIAALKRRIQDAARASAPLADLGPRRRDGRAQAVHRSIPACRSTSATRTPLAARINENTNGLLRQYLPKGTDLAVHDQAALDEIARKLNGRPARHWGG